MLVGKGSKFGGLDIKRVYFGWVIGSRYLTYVFPPSRLPPYLGFLSGTMFPVYSQIGVCLARNIEGTFNGHDTDASTPAEINSHQQGPST